MRLTTALFRALVAIVLAGGVPATVGAGSPEGDGILRSRLRRIEGAFREGDANALRRSCSAAGKVRVELRDLTDGGSSYAPGQLQVIFGQIFSEQNTREMVFDPDDVPPSPSGTAFVRGRWVRRPRHGGLETVDTLTFTLREESGDWRIIEIRSSR